MESNNGRTVTVIVVALNSLGDTELLAYDLDLTAEECEDSLGSELAMDKARENEYEPQTAFELTEMAGRQLRGLEPMYGDDPRYATDLTEH
ncbi:MAG: hypothetical protein ACYC3W_07040 [Candidatus Nanopelagicales bacterium]